MTAAQYPIAPALAQPPDPQGPKRGPSTSPRSCIIVLGMHRSGTSALTRVVNILGAALPRHVLGAGAGNETGHWEPAALVKFHDDLLAGLGSAWHDWTPLNVSRLTDHRRAKIKSQIITIINDEYPTTSPFVVKDPRVCRFAPLFLEALSDAGIAPECVLLFRNPLEVVQSLKRRDDMPAGQASLLWLRHVLDAEAATRGYRRAVVGYGGLLSDWRRELRGLSVVAATGRATFDDAARRIAEFLNPAQRHHVHADAELSAEPLMSGWIADVHGALQELRQDPASHQPFAIFDRVRLEFDRAAPAIASMHGDRRDQGNAGSGPNGRKRKFDDVVVAPLRRLAGVAMRAAQLRAARQPPACDSRGFAAALPGLAQHYYGSDANRKPPIYLAEYERLFGPIRSQPIRLLELGVRFGASMLVWRDYFPHATIVGLDIGDRPAAFPVESRFHFIQGSQDDPEALQRCTVAAGGPFDIIIDDASHIGQLSSRSFDHLFSRALKPAGFYVIDDIRTAFLPDFRDSEPFVPHQAGQRPNTRHFPSRQAGMVDLVKQLFDHVMAPAAQGSPSTNSIESMLVLPNIAIMQKSAQIELA